MIPAGYEIDWSSWIAGLAAAVALISALMANVVAKRSLNTAAELEIIKLREKWISEVREEMTIAISLASIPVEENELTVKENNTRFLTSITKLTLLLAHENEETVEVLEEILKLRNSQIDNNQATPEEAIVLGKKILKAEWSRLITDIENAKAG